MRTHSKLKILKHCLGAYLTALCLCPSTFAARSWSWSAETADRDASVKFTSIAVDQRGNLHVAYSTDKNFGQLNYAYRSADSSQWYTLPLDKQLGSFYAYIAVDPRGNPQICYTPRQVKYAFWDGKQWTIVEIAPHSGVAEYSCSLIISSDGKPHVIWYQTHAADNGWFLHLRHAVFDQGAWMVGTVDFDGEAGKWNSIVLDDRGFPHVTYSQFPHGELRYAYWNGKTWVSSIVDSPLVVNTGPEGAARGMGNSLLLNRQNQWTISYYDFGSLKYATQIGDRWKTETVDHLASASTLLGGWATYRSFQVLDSRGMPHIGYEDGGAIKHAYWDGKDWSVQVVLGATGDVYRYSSMTIDSHDNLYISYRDPATGSLKVAIGHAVEEQSTLATDASEESGAKP